MQYVYNTYYVITQIHTTLYILHKNNTYYTNIRFRFVTIAQMRYFDILYNTYYNIIIKRKVINLLVRLIE